MGTKSSDKADRHSYAFHAHTEEMPNVWSGVLLWGVNDELVASVEVVGHTLTDIALRAVEVMFSVQGELRQGKLILPDMGDYQVRYAPKKDNKDH